MLKVQTSNGMTKAGAKEKIRGYTSTKIQDVTETNLVKPERSQWGCGASNYQDEPHNSVRKTLIPP